MMDRGSCRVLRELEKMSIDSVGRLGSCSRLYHNEVEILNPRERGGLLAP